MIKRFYKPVIIFILAFLVSLPIILPYFHTGYFPTHDGEWAVVRMGDMFRSLRDHQFPVRYSGYLNFGYGYPLFNFTYPAPYYLGVLLYFFKLGFVNSIKLEFAFSVVLSAITMYLLSNEIWKNKTAGLISAIFYVYFPYRIVDLYARGSIGESLAFAIFPLILFCALKILDNVNPKLYIVLGSISYALLILTHNIMAVLFTPLLFIFIVTKMYKTKSRPYLNIFIFILLSYSLSAFFWLSALLEEHNISLFKTPIANRNIYFVHLDQLLWPKWGYGLPDAPNGFSYQIGPAHVIILLVVSAVLIYFIMVRRKLAKNSYSLFALVTAATTFILTVLMFSFTKIVWQVTPLLKEINYPWTLLAPIGFLTSLLSGFLWLQKKLFKYLVIILCFFAIILTFPYAKPQFFINKGDLYYLTNDATTTSSDELMPLWVKQKPFQKTDKKVEIIKGSGNLGNIFSNSKQVIFNADLKDNSIIQVNTIYWPGWIVFIDGQQVPISYNNPGGLIRFTALKGAHQIRLDFRESPSRLISDIVSLISVVIILILVIRIIIFRKRV